MRKKLSDMSLEELWELFPVFLTGHQECWEEWYREEEQMLGKALEGAGIVRISHIGSTAVETIWAKPIIDILVEVSGENGFAEPERRLLGCGYRCMSRGEQRFSFNKGYTEAGFAEKVFHLHLRCEGDNDELYFRDYLRLHDDTAREYERLKFKLWEKYEHNRDAYTSAKTEFVSKYTERAKREFGPQHSAL
ncbi:MAG: GrpB family protein [Lachnospiraceae bacterium]|nr:GrpB family protein [Lachnospiraceae bacterium]